MPSAPSDRPLPPPPCVPVRCRRRPGPRRLLLLAWASALAVGLLAAPRARAACTADGDDRWVCTGLETTPFTIVGEDGQVVIVREGALVRTTSTSIAVGTDTLVVLEPTAIVDAMGTGATAISGMIQTRIRNEGGIFATGTGSRAIVLDPGGAVVGISDVENDEVISASGDFAAAIEVGGRTKIINRDVIDASGANAAAILVIGTDNEIENSGYIQARNGAVAIRMADGGSANPIVNRAGAVIAAFPGGFDPTATVFATAIEGGSGSEKLTNRGLILGDVLLGGGDDRVVLVTGSAIAGLLDGEAGSDRLRVVGDGRLELDLGSTAGFETLELDAPGIVSLAGSGTFSDEVLLRQGVVEVPGDVVITGDVDQRARNQLAIGIQQGFLDVQGSFRGRGELRLVPQGFVEDDTYALIRASGGIDDTYDLATGVTPLLDVQFVRTPDTLSVAVTRNSYASVAVTDNQREIGQYLDLLAPLAVDGELEPELDVLLGLLDIQDLSGVLQGYDAISPEYYDAHTSAAFDMGREFDAVLLNPPVVCRVGEGPGARRVWRPCGGRDVEPWFLGWGSYLDRNAVGGNIGYEQRGGGLAIGVQNWLASWLEVGAGVGAARRRIDVKDNGRGSLTTADLGVNAAASWGPVVARAAASFGYGWHDARRDADWPDSSRAADSDFDHQRVGVTFEVASHADFGALRLEPYGGLDYTWLREEKVDENGAGALDLDVDERTNSLLAANTGLRLRAYLYRDEPFGELYDFSQTLFVPELRVGYRRVLLGADRDLSAEIEGAPSSVGDFDVDAKDAEELWTGGIGLTAQPKGGATVGLFYDVLYGDRNIAHVGSFEVRIPLQMPGT